LEALNQKTRKVGRPLLKKGRAKSIVPVRIQSNYLKRMNSAAKDGNKTLSTWIRSTLKGALKQGGFMNEYEQQIESGKEIVKGVLANLATELREPQLNDLTFKMTDGDFDYDRISLMDPQFHIVAKIQEDDLADCPADRNVRSKLETQLRQAVQAFYGPKNKRQFSN
jgi:hypothetical protein